MKTLITSNKDLLLGVDYELYKFESAKAVDIIHTVKNTLNYIIQKVLRQQD